MIVIRQAPYRPTQFGIARHAGTAPRRAAPVQCDPHGSGASGRAKGPWSAGCGLFKPLTEAVIGIVYLD
jgi:hypothetical protein